ncbi:amid-like nadh [Lichtheimia corymbifera JMRC:FSU:9682]|uniref:Amid-like nadh n=1 Tax=Lichtheimia corymbifera JMRC:FSU:9682 TaxID=1263082 RepID=A0A068SDZ1_9FUNG|nr:amid-like nadh [Lichtheimia corymbifera JMRC:FSU:9682]
MTGMQNIIILGGGYAGVGVARALEKRIANNNNYRIILIEKREFFYHAVAAPRTLVEDIDNMIPYSGVFKHKKNQVVQASVVKLESNQIHLDQEFEGSHHVPFAFSVIATGTSHPDPFKLAANGREEGTKRLADVRQQIKDAQSIVIVGGGPTGIECSGEIRGAYKDKKITLVHRGSQLLSKEIPDKPRMKLLEKMRQNNIHVIFNDTIPSLPTERHDSVHVPATAPFIHTEQGKKLDCDLLLVAFGNRPNTAWIDPSLLAKNGFVKVKPTLQVDAQGYENVYVVGDAADLQETKLAAKSRGHISVVSNNIAVAIKGNTKPSKVYNGSPNISAITFGKQQGMIITPWFCLGDWVTGNLKGKTMMVERFWGELGLQYPKQRSSENKSSWMLWMTGGFIALSTYYLLKSTYPSILSSIQESIINLSQQRHISL